MKNIKLLTYYLKYFKNKKKIIFVILILTLTNLTLGITFPGLIQRLIDEAILLKNSEKMIEISIRISVIFFLTIIISYLQSYLALIFSNEFIYYYKVKFLKKFFDASYSKIEEKNIGNVINLFESDLSTVTGFCQTVIFGIITNFIQLIGLFYYLYVLNNKIALMTAGIFSVYFIAVRMTHRYFNRVSRFLRSKNLKINSFVYERFYNVFFIKSLSKADNELKKYELCYRDFLKGYYSVSKMNMMIDSLKDFISFYGSVVIVLYSGFLVIYGEITTGTLFAANTLFGAIYQPASFFVNLRLNFYKILVSFEKLKEFLECPEENLKGRNLDEAKVIKLENITFSYKGNINVLENFTAEFNKGQIKLLKGPNGSGKSTLAFLKTGFYIEKLSSGKITINDYDIKEINVKSLRNKIVYMPQKVEIFSGELKNFMEIKKEEFFEKMEKIKRYEIGDILLQKGSEYYINQGANNLSGGERQRIYLANLLLNDYDFYIFDEFESAQDVINRENLKNVIKILKENGKGIILITHSNYFDDICDDIINLK
ncbi:MAG: ABC transporter ATP-binding protein [Candidatus Wallbacteria bacterium]